MLVEEAILLVQTALRCRVTTGKCEMSVDLETYMGHELYSDFNRYKITAAFKKPVFTPALSHYWEIAWKHKKVKEWSSEDVMAWFLYVIEEQEHKDIVESKLHKFNVEGATLMCMTEYQFAARDPLYGRILYRDLQKRLQEEQKADIPLSLESLVPYLMCSVRSASPVEGEERAPTAVCKLPDLPELPCNWDSIWMNTPIYGWSERDVMAWILYVLDKENLPIDKIDLTRFKCTGADLLRMSKDEFKERSPDYGQKLYEAAFCKKSEFDNTRSDSEDSMDDPPEMPSEPEGKRGGGHGFIWLFLRDLLKSGKNSEVIDWVNREEGTFKVKDTKKLAEMWGELRNNRNMTYEKMSRALRYNYKSGYLKKVQPRQKLYFGFGPSAKGWKSYEDLPFVQENRTEFTRLPSFLSDADSSSCRAQSSRFHRLYSL